MKACVSYCIIKIISFCYFNISDGNFMLSLTVILVLIVYVGGKSWIFLNTPIFQCLFQRLIGTRRDSNHGQQKVFLAIYSA